MAALGTLTLVEVAGLASGTLRLVRQRGPLLVGWYCAGWAVHQAGLFASALLGVRHGVLANLTFVLAVVATLVSLVLMVSAVGPRPDLGGRGSSDLTLDGPVPPALLAQERTIDVVTLAVGPFLAVYAVWGFLDDEVAALFKSNYVVQGLGGIDDWSISVDARRVPLYLGLAAGGWLVRAVVRAVLRRRRSDVVAVVGVAAEGVWALSVFVVVVVVVRAAKGWLTERVVWAELVSAGLAVISVMPSITLPFGPTLREAVRAAVEQVPGFLATVVGLPLMWLALAAVVYGWRDVSATDALAGTPVASRLERWSRHGTSPVGRAVLLLTGDLRTKYVPVLLALRLVARAGPRLIGAYLLLATALQSLDQVLQIAVSVLPGPRSVAVTLLLEPVSDLAVSLVVTVASVALYGAVFARVVGQAQGSSVSTGPSRTSSRPESPGTSAAGTTKEKPVSRGTS